MDIVFTIINVVTAVVTLASVIAAVTPTKKDDEFIAKYLKPIVNALALNIGNAKK
tara:strand:- start:185 stop:349 length:165 start_codon:yes stop_codon:yes gene_type:complete